MKKKSLVLLLVFVLTAMTMLAGCTSSGGGGGTTGGGGGSSEGTDWPTQTVKIIVPFGAGGSTDLIFRTLSEQLTKDLGVNFVVENKEGGSGSLGLAEACNSAPDGYTFSIGMGSNMCMVPNMSDTGYTAEDFTPICQVTNTPLCVAVNKDLPITTLDEYIEYAKANGISYSSSGANNTQQVTISLLAEHEGFEWTSIPQDSGANAVAQCIGGHVDSVFAVATDFKSAYENDELRILCTFDNQRYKDFPDIPCSAELGYDYVTFGVWYALVGPKGIDPAIVEKFDAAVAAALETDFVKDAYEKMAVSVAYLDHNDLAAKIPEFDKLMDEVMADW